MKLPLQSLLVLFTMQFTFYQEVAADDTPAPLVLLGDSTVITSYLPEEQRPQTVLRELLAPTCTGQTVRVVNEADNGEFIARFLLNGAYEKMRARLPEAGIFLLRFGINDQKWFSPEEFGAQLHLLIDLLQQNYPKAEIILETGIYVDKNHYRSDRNRILSPYWDITRKAAEARRLGLCDIYAAMEKETAGGNWDLRVRRAAADEPRVLDASQDEGKDMAWFSDIHPNAEGVRVASRAEAKILKSRYPEKLPAGGRRVERAARLEAEFAELLSFGRERFSKKQKTQEDQFQTPVRP